MIGAWIIQRGDNVVLKDWCCGCDTEKEDCKTRFFVLEESSTGDKPWTKISCYSSGDSGYQIGKLYYKYSYELRRI